MKAKTIEMLTSDYEELRNERDAASARVADLEGLLWHLLTALKTQTDDCDDPGVICDLILEIEEAIASGEKP